MIRHISTSRRTVLGSIVTGAAVAVSGCMSGSSETKQSEADETKDGDSGIFDAVFVEGMDLVLELTEESSIDHVNVIAPDGELFAERTIPTGVRRETIQIGTSYTPGDYEIIALEDEEEQATQSLTIEPDVNITDLRLARNHPEEMFEGASDIDIRTETIIRLENTGTGPDEIVGLSFSGDIPRPTPSNFSESGIYDTESDLNRHADSVELPPGGEILIFSQLMPFSASGDNVSCSPNTVEGEFEVTLESAVREDPTSASYMISYTGKDLNECEIEVESKT